MSNRTRIVATYRIDGDELIQCSMSIPSNYPDAISEGEQLTDVLRQTRPAAERAKDE